MSAEYRININSCERIFINTVVDFGISDLIVTLYWFDGSVVLVVPAGLPEVELALAAVVVLSLADEVGFVLAPAAALAVVSDAEAVPLSFAVLPACPEVFKVVLPCWAVVVES